MNLNLKFKLCTCEIHLNLVVLKNHYIISVLKKLILQLDGTFEVGVWGVKLSLQRDTRARARRIRREPGKSSVSVSGTIQKTKGMLLPYSGTVRTQTQIRPLNSLSHDLNHQRLAILQHSISEVKNILQGIF